MSFCSFEMNWKQRLIRSPINERMRLYVFMSIDRFAFLGGLNILFPIALNAKIFSTEFLFFSNRIKEIQSGTCSAIFFPVSKGYERSHIPPLLSK
jgi:hypothetical protein